MEPVTLQELIAALPHVMAAPKDNAPVLGLCLRPGYGARTFVDQVEMTREFGICGERWATAPWLRCFRCYRPSSATSSSAATTRRS